MITDEIFGKARQLTFTDIDRIATKHVREVVFKVLFSCGGVAPLEWPLLKSGKKYDIYLSDDIEENLAEQVEVFVHELLHIWLCEEYGLKHGDEYENEISATVRVLVEKYNRQLNILLGCYLVK